MRPPNIRTGEFEMASIVPEMREHAPQIEALLDQAFGPGRFAKTAYRLREGVDPITALSFVAIDEGGQVLGSLRFWPILIGAQTKAILLGPLAIDQTHRSNGLGQSLMAKALERATQLGHRICVLVGDEPYYAKAGFTRSAAKGLSFPGPVDLNRLLARALVPGALDGVAGLIRPDRSTALAPPGQEQQAQHRHQ
jgi:predicted N-acetyltransferase YhbS